MKLFKHKTCRWRFDPEGQHALNGYRCTRPHGHHGDHIARDPTGKIVFCWGHNEGVEVSHAVGS